MRFRPLGWMPLLLASALATAPDLSSAADFAIETQVYEAGGPEPVAENLTVFSGALIYDFGLTPPQRVTVFDPAAQHFRLSDQTSRVLTTLPVDQLLEFVAAERARAQESHSEWVRFAAAPSFSEQFDESSGQLRLNSPYWDYEVQTIPVTDAEQLKRYLQFAHWYTQLNALFRPLPPGVRLQLNESLSRHRRIPVRVVARIKRDGALLVEQESRHKMIWTLTRREQQKIQQWEDQQAHYRPVSVREYLRAYH